MIKQIDIMSLIKKNTYRLDEHFDYLSYDEERGLYFTYDHCFFFILEIDPVIYLSFTYDHCFFFILEIDPVIYLSFRDLMSFADIFNKNDVYQNDDIIQVSLIGMYQKENVYRYEYE